MKGWSEDEFADKRLMAPCGLYCGACGVYISHRDGNTKFRDVLARLYGSKPEETKCKGCMQEDPPDCLYGFCTMCKIRDCVRGKSFYSCHQCDEFPCQHIGDFPMTIGKKVILRAVPHWREVGTEQWIRDEEARYVCPECGNKVFRGAVKCNQCKATLDLD